jgi:hypothetical protein
MERSMEKDKVGFRFQAKVIQKLCRWGSHRLKTPSLVEDGMMTRFDDTGREIDVADILAGCCVAKENAGKVVSIQLATSRSGAFDTYLSTKSLEIGDVCFRTIPCFVGCFVDSGMD